MTLRQSFPTDSTAGQSVTDTRLTNAALVARDAAGMPRPGVIFDSPARIVSPTSSMAYLVRDLRAVTMRTPGGVEFLANDGAVTIPTTPAPASNARIDIIYMRARFIANADGSSLPEFGVRQSAPAVNPVDPALPVGALPLARFVIPAIATSTQASGVVGVDIAPFTCAAGGTLTVRTPAELENWKPADGAKAYSLSDTSEYVRKNGSWGQGISTAKAVMSQGWNVATDLGYEDVIRKSPDGLCTFNTLLFAETGGINAIFSSPPGFRPTGPVFVGESRSVLTGSNLTGSIRMDQSGLATMPVGYYAGSAGPRAYYPVALHWRAA